jgi:hypothetical protein
MLDFFKLFTGFAMSPHAENPKEGIFLEPSFTRISARRQFGPQDIATCGRMVG